MDFLYDPIDAKEPTGFEPLEWDDNVYEDDDDALFFDNSIEEEEYDEPGLPGFDDLKPFGSFDDGFGWEDGYL